MFVEFHLHSSYIKKVSHLCQFSLNDSFVSDSLEESLAFNIAYEEITSGIGRLLHILYAFIFNKTWELICAYLCEKYIDPLERVHLCFKLSYLIARVCKFFIVTFRLFFTGFLILRSLAIRKFYFLFLFSLHIKNFKNCFNIIFIDRLFDSFFLFLWSYF